MRRLKVWESKTKLFIHFSFLSFTPIEASALASRGENLSHDLKGLILNYSRSLNGVSKLMMVQSLKGGYGFPLSSSFLHIVLKWTVIHS